MRVNSFRQMMAELDDKNYPIKIQDETLKAIILNMAQMSHKDIVDEKGDMLDEPESTREKAHSFSGFSLATALKDLLSVASIVSVIYYRYLKTKNVRIVKVKEEDGSQYLEIQSDRVRPVYLADILATE
jgi:hypothetical protein